jgi:hypothetical protein
MTKTETYWELLFIRMALKHKCNLSVGSNFSLIVDKLHPDRCIDVNLARSVSDGSIEPENAVCLRDDLARRMHEALTNNQVQHFYLDDSGAQVLYLDLDTAKNHLSDALGALDNKASNGKQQSDRIKRNRISYPFGRS